MGTYMGQPVSAVVERLGFPTSEQVIAGNKVYIWSTVRFDEGTSLSCKIRAIVDQQQIIIAWDLEGQEYGCAGYAARLNR